jgi:hypothetical protein
MKCAPVALLDFGYDGGEVRFEVPAASEGG